MISTTNLPAFPFARPLLPFLSLITQPPLPFPSSILPGTAPVCFPRRLPSFPLRPTTHSMRLPTSISPNQSLFSLLSCVTIIYCLRIPPRGVASGIRPHKRLHSPSQRTMKPQATMNACSQTSSTIYWTTRLLPTHPTSRLLSQWQPRTRPCVLQERGGRDSTGR